MENEAPNHDERRDQQESGSEQPDVTINDVFALLSGAASLETRKRIAKAVYNPEHPLSYLARQSSDDQEFQADWPPNDIPDAIKELLND